MSEIDAAITVKIDAAFVVRRRQELCLTDFARIGAHEIAQRQVSALHDSECGDELRLKEIRASTIVRKRRESAHDRQVSHVAGAVVTLERPDRHKDFSGHAKLALDACKQLCMACHHRFCALDARRRDARCSIALEALTEGAVLAAVEGEHSGIWCQSCKSLAHQAG